MLRAGGRPSHVASSSAGYDPTKLSYLTAWYYSTTPANGAGWGNPNNTNPGFVQDDDQSASPAVGGGWSAGNTSFACRAVTGGNGDVGDCATSRRTGS